MANEQTTATVLSSTGKASPVIVKTHMPARGEPTLGTWFASYEELKPLMSDKPLRGPAALGDQD